nr:MAG TPA: hypothetical protein [Caudoviricetes sp.]
MIKKILVTTILYCTSSMLLAYGLFQYCMR